MAYTIWYLWPKIYPWVPNYLFVQHNEKIHYHGENEFEKYNGVKLDESGGLTDEDFVKEIKRILKKNKMEVIEEGMFFSLCWTMR